MGMRGLWVLRKILGPKKDSYASGQANWCLAACRREVRHVTQSFWRTPGVPLRVLGILSHFDSLGVNQDPCENGIPAPKTHLKNAAYVLY